jgi:ATP-dependent Zn protease
VKPDRRHVAYHEAGHAVIALRLGYELIDVTVKPHRRTEGSFLVAKMRRPRADHIKLYLAGAIAEALVSPTPFYGASGDWRRICRIARDIARPEEVIEECLEETEVLVQQNAGVIAKVAEALLKHKTLRGDEVARIIKIADLLDTRLKKLRDMDLAEPPTIFDGFCFEPRVERQADGFKRRM